MKTSFILLGVIAAIVMEQAMAEYLLVEVDGKDLKYLLKIFHSIYYTTINI